MTNQKSRSIEDGKGKNFEEIELEEQDWGSRGAVPPPVSAQAPESGNKWQRWYQKMLRNNPWARLSKRWKTVIIVSASFAVLIVLIAAIVLPIGEAASAERWYYIAAEEVDWDYVPLGRNFVRDDEFNLYEKTYVGESDNRIGSRYKKAIYVEYNKSFKKRIPRPAEESHLGLLGPVIRAEVGDTIKVVLKNNLNFNISIHATGVAFEKESEGIKYNNEIPLQVPETGQTEPTTGEEPGDKRRRNKRDETPEDKVQGYNIPPGGQYTYTWYVPEEAGPTTDEFSSVSWAYFSGVDRVRDFHSGLVGPIIITKKGSAYKESGGPADVDRELFILPTIFDENESHFIDENMAALNVSNPAELKVDPGFIESNKKYTLNGYMYGNLPTLVLPKVRRSRWYLFGMGPLSHTLLWSGQTLVRRTGERTSTITTFPGSSYTADMLPLVDDTWLLSSYGTDAAKGMEDLFTVVPADEFESNINGEGGDVGKRRNLKYIRR